MRKEYLLVFLLLFILPFNVKAGYCATDSNQYALSLNGTPNGSISGGVCSAYVSNVSGGVTTVRFSYSGSGCGTSNYTVGLNSGVKSGSLVYKEDWKCDSVNIGPYSSKFGNLKSDITANQAYEWQTRSDGYYIVESCGRCNTPSPTPTRESERQCFASNNLNNDTTTYAWGSKTKNNSGGWNYNYPDSLHHIAVSDSYCNSKPVEIPSLCSTGIKEESDIKYANTCEGDTLLEVNDTICGTDNYNNTYFKIESKTDYLANFDMNKDGKIETTLNLKSGESFAYDVKVTSKKRAQGTFYASTWISEYQTYENPFKILKGELGDDFGQSKIARAQNIADSRYSLYEDARKELENTPQYTTCTITHSDGTKETYDCVTAAYEACEVAADEAWNRYKNAKDELDLLKSKSARMYELDNAMEGMEAIVTNYKREYVDMEYLDKNEPNVKLEFAYKSDGRTYNTEVALIKNEKKSQDGEIARNKVLAANPYHTARGTTIEMWNFDYNNYDNPRIRYMQPSEVSVDKRSGEITSVLQPVSGYNRIYTEKKNVDKGLYSVKITIDNIGTDNKESKIINEMCKLNYQENELLFRVIDVSNPFINNSYVPGINWKDGRYKYNFVGIIDSSIWSQVPEGEVLLDTSRIKLIQNDNSVEKYLGTCDLPTSNSAICSLIR